MFALLRQALDDWRATTSSMVLEALSPRCRDRAEERRHFLARRAQELRDLEKSGRLPN